MPIIPGNEGITGNKTNAKLLFIQWCSFSGKFAIIVAFSTQYVTMSELYSTDIRSIGISFGSMISRIAGFLTPYIILMPPLAYNLVFAGRKLVFFVKYLVLVSIPTV